jgi:RNA polymerase sigma-70 factor (ECF subfamily)
LKRDRGKSLNLWARLQDDDVEALGLLYDRYVDELFIYGRRFSADKSLVLDGIHDLFLNLYKYRKNLSQPSRVDFYLMRSLKNTILMRVKNQRHDLPADQNICDPLQFSVEEGLIANEWEMERSQKLTKALNLLSKKQGKGIALRFTENFSYEEIAASMNISVQSSRTMVYRAIKALRKQMQSVILLFLIIFSFFFK